MIVRNRSTKKEHECKRVDWDRMTDKHKGLFDIINPNDTDKEIKVTGSLKPVENTQTKQKRKTNE